MPETRTRSKYHVTRLYSLPLRDVCSHLFEGCIPLEVLGSLPHNGGFSALMRCGRRPHSSWHDLGMTHVH